MRNDMFEVAPRADPPSGKTPERRFSIRHHENRRDQYLVVFESHEFTDTYPLLHLLFTLAGTS